MCKNDVFVAKICNCKIRCFLSRKFANARSALALRDIWRSPLARQLIAACKLLKGAELNSQEHVQNGRNLKPLCRIFENHSPNLCKGSECVCGPLVARLRRPSPGGETCSRGAKEAPGVSRDLWGGNPLPGLCSVHFVWEGGGLVGQIGRHQLPICGAFSSSS